MRARQESLALFAVYNFYSYSFDFLGLISYHLKCY